MQKSTEKLSEKSLEKSSEESNDTTTLGIKPMLYTIVFEMKKNRKKFYVFSIMVILLNVLQIVLTMIPEFGIASTQTGYISSGLSFMSMLMVFGVCFFFGGIICSEFSTHTGYITFPKLNKYKLIVGKYIGNLILFIGVIALYYFIIALQAIYFYGAPLNIRFYYSFFMAVFYILAISSFVTMISSFMRSIPMAVISSLLILMMVFGIVDQIVVMLNPDFEPIYSIEYMSRLITSVLAKDFPVGADRYTEFNMRGFSFRMWNTPSIEVGITVLLIYMSVCFTLAALFFKRRQL